MGEHVRRRRLNPEGPALAALTFALFLLILALVLGLAAGYAACGEALFLLIAALIFAGRRDIGRLAGRRANAVLGTSGDWVERAVVIVLTIWSTITVLACAAALILRLVQEL
jgi:hypothetical protein